MTDTSAITKQIQTLLKDVDRTQVHWLARRILRPIVRSAKLHYISRQEFLEVCAQEYDDTPAQEESKHG